MLKSAQSAMLKIADVMYKIATLKVLLDWTDLGDCGVSLWWFPKSDSYLLEMKRKDEVKCQRLFSKLGKAVKCYNDWVEEFKLTEK